MIVEHAKRAKGLRDGAERSETLTPLCGSAKQTALLLK